MITRTLPIPELPLQQESCIGYFDRLGILHGYSGAQELLNTINAGVQCATLNNSSGINKAVKALKKVFPKDIAKDIDQVLVSAQDFKQFRLKHLRTCPLCIQSGDVHLNSFVSIEVTVCPLHQCMLIDSCTNCRSRVDTTVLNRCGNCGTSFPVVEANYEPTHRQLILDMSKRNVEYLRTVVMVIKLLTRPFDMVETPLVMRELTVEQSHISFLIVSRFIYCSKFRAEYVTRLMVEISSLAVLGAGESQQRLKKLTSTVKKLNEFERINWQSPKSPNINEIICALAPAVQAGYYEARLPTMYHLPAYWLGLLTKKGVKELLHLESNSFDYLKEHILTNYCHGKLSCHKTYYIDDIKNALLKPICLNDKRFWKEIRFSDINPQVLSRFHIRKTELLVMIINGEVAARRIPLTSNLGIYDSIIVDVEALEKKAKIHFENYSKSISVEEFSWLSSIKPSLLIKAHNEEPFEGLVINAQQMISAQSAQAFFNNYIVMPRLVYLTKINQTELKEYLDSANTDNRRLSNEKEVSAVYKRNNHLEAIIQDLLRLGKLDTKFDSPN